MDEITGKSTTVSLNQNDLFRSAIETDAIEYLKGKTYGSGKKVSIKINPYEIKSLLLTK